MIDRQQTRLRFFCKQYFRYVEYYQMPIFDKILMWIFICSFHPLVFIGIMSKNMIIGLLWIVPLSILHIRKEMYIY